MTQYRIVQKKDTFHIQKKGWWFWNDQPWWNTVAGVTMGITSKFYTKSSAEKALEEILQTRKAIRELKERTSALPDFKIIKEVDDADG